MGICRQSRPSSMWDALHRKRWSRLCRKRREVVRDYHGRKAEGRIAAGAEICTNEATKLGSRIRSAGIGNVKPKPIGRHNRLW